MQKPLFRSCYLTAGSYIFHLFSLTAFAISLALNDYGSNVSQNNYWNLTSHHCYELAIAAVWKLKIYLQYLNKKIGHLNIFINYILLFLLLQKNVRSKKSRMKENLKYIADIVSFGFRFSQTWNYTAHNGIRTPCL